MAVRSLAEVEHWVKANSIEALRKALAERRFDDDSQKLVSEWLSTHDRAEAEKVAQAQREIDRGISERSTRASERSAEAAVAAAAAAVDSARWARWSVVVALLAVLVAALAYLKS